jgi:hypothetical protein
MCPMPVTGPTARCRETDEMVMLIAFAIALAGMSMTVSPCYDVILSDVVSMVELLFLVLFLS